MSSQSWVTIKSLTDGSRFSDVMSDEVTIEQQRKEELAATVPPSEGSIVSGNSRRTEQWVDETCRERTNELEEGWPNSNVTNELAAEEGCSRAPVGAEANPSLQATVDQDLTYVGGMSYARSRDHQMHTVLNAINIMRREKSLPRHPSVGEGVQSGSSARAPEQPHPNQAIKPELVSALKPSTSRSAAPRPEAMEGQPGI